MYLASQIRPLLVLLVVLSAACGRSGDSGTEVVHYATTSSVPPSRSVPTTEGRPSSFYLHAVDQRSDGTAVTVKKAVVTGSPGWIVVHADDNGAPGPVIGTSAQVPAGTSTDVVVPLRAPLTRTALVHPMLHLEDNSTITCEFPAADAPVELDGELVVSPITVTVGG